MTKPVTMRKDGDDYVLEIKITRELLLDLHALRGLDPNEILVSIVTEEVVGVLAQADLLSKVFHHD